MSGKCGVCGTWGVEGPVGGCRGLWVYEEGPEVASEQKLWGLFGPGGLRGL